MNVNKKFYQVTNLKQKNKAKHIIYFCNKHYTTITSNSFTKSNNLNKISKCKARVYYIKNKGEYYLDWEHSRFYNEIVKKKYENTADINNEIINYLKFKD